MGSWGYGPYDNDDAQDLACQVEKPMLKAILESFKRVKPSKRGGVGQGYEKAIAAASMLVAYSKRGSFPDLSYEARRGGVYASGNIAMDVVVKDTLWIENFDNPRRIRKAVESLRGELKSADRAAKRAEESAASFFVMPKQKKRKAAA